MTWLSEPWAWWVDPFVDNGFMRDALVAGLLTVIATSTVGTWVVLRGMSFLGDALAHGCWRASHRVQRRPENDTGALSAAGAMVRRVSLIGRTSPSRRRSTRALVGFAHSRS